MKYFIIILSFKYHQTDMCILSSELYPMLLRTGCESIEWNINLMNMSLTGLFF